MRIRMHARNRCVPPMPVLAMAMALALALALPTGRAVAQSADDLQTLREELKSLREEQARIAEWQQRNEAAIRALETRLGAIAPVSPAPATPPPPAIAAPAPASAASDRFTLSGDLRLRAQYDTSDDDAPNRSSGQIRARIGATHAFNDRITIGARLVTGDSNDPNSADVQLSHWNDDLEVSLDLAYAQLDVGKLKFYGGKFPQPFARTDLVWDGDVNPQGIGASYRNALGNGAALRGNALYFVVDERAGGADSTMAGLQLGYDSPALGAFRYDLSGTYYHYSLGSMAGADAGDWRSNRLGPDGRFLSDYRLLDVIAGVSWQGRNDKWPLRVVGDYVRNLGAIDNRDSGLGVDVILGRASKPGDWRFTYGYSQTDVDAVMSAFSHDNIGIATNYKLHALTVDYTPMPKTAISAIWYHYKPNDAAYAGSHQPDDWLDRLRVFLLMSF